MRRPAPSVPAGPRAAPGAALRATLRAALLPALVLALLGAPPASAQEMEPAGEPPAAWELDPAITSPVDAFGHRIGADYVLIDYEELHGYWETLTAESERMALDTIGTSAQGRPQIMAILTSPENHAELDRYRRIARRLARAEGVSEADARRLADEGKAVVWIDGGLHATEVLGAQQLTELVYQMTARGDDETLRFLDDVILLAVHANPDGHALVANWYMRTDEPEERSSRGVPVLYQEYAGHDNNRDFYASNLSETINMNRVAYREWFPQIIYNHHQTGPSGTIMFAPPFRDPPNHYLPPLMLTSIQQVGYAMHGRFVQEGKGGTTSRSGASYSTWWNGGLRTTPYFHNQIGLLTETRGRPNPIEIPFIPDRQLPHSDLPLPVEPGTWHFRQSVDYSQTANRAVLDYASRNREHVLFNIWRMGMNAVEEGRRDSWTNLPREIYDAERMVRRRGTRDDWKTALRRPEDRDPRGYVIPSDQADFLTATKFVNALRKNGILVERATADFEVAGKTYPAGSYVVKTAQASAAFVQDMFEPQNYPDDFAYPGGPPIAPYDNAGWTLAYQMDVEFDRILDGFDGPFRRIEGMAEPPAGEVTGGTDAAGWLLSHEVNDAFIAVNRLLADDHDVYWITEEATVGGMTAAPGTFWIPSGGGVREALRGMAGELGLDFRGAGSEPRASALRLRPVTVGLWDEYGGSMPSGWTRFIFDRFEVPYRLVFPPELDEADLSGRFDVLVFPDGAVPEDESDEDDYDYDEEFLETIPDEYRGRIGAITVDGTIPRIIDFMEAGGAVVTVGSSTTLAHHADLSVRNHLVDRQGRPLDDEEYYVPGSVLDVKVEQASPLAHGLGPRANVLFSRSPVFDLTRRGRDGGGRYGSPDASESDPLTRLGWFDHPEPLRSGWAWGQDHLEGGTTIAEADVGEGKLFLFGPKVTFRGQSHGTFPFVFNAIYYGTAEEVELGR